MSIAVYKPSGKMGPTALPFALGAGLVVGGGLGWLYQMLVDFNPFIYINALATLGLGAAVGAAVGFAAHMGKCRNPMIAMVLAFSIGVATEAATFYYAYLNTTAKAFDKLKTRARGRSGFTLEKLRKRVSMSKYIEIRVKNGWKISSAPISGVFVYIIWLIELLMIAVTAALIGRGSVSQPFCERRGEWAEEIQLGLLPGVDLDYLLEARSADDLNALISVDDIPLEEDSPMLATYTGYKCMDGGYVSLTVTWPTIDDKGNESNSTEEILEYATVDEMQFANLQDALAG